MTVDKMAPRRGEFKSAVEVRRPPLARPPARARAASRSRMRRRLTAPLPRAQGAAILEAADVVIGM